MSEQLTINTELIKTLLSIPQEDETYDILISNYIPVMTEFVQSYTKRQFDTVEEIPLGLLMVMAKLIQFSIKDVSVNSYSVDSIKISYSDFPDYLLNMLDSYVNKQVKFL